MLDLHDKVYFCFLVRNQDLNFCRYLRQVQRLWVRSLWGLEAVELHRESTALAGLSVPVSPSLLPSHCHFLPMKSYPELEAVSSSYTWS